MMAVPQPRSAQLAELSRSEFNPELFSYSTYDKIFVTITTKVPYLTFCDKMRQFLVYEMDREGGNALPFCTHMLKSFLTEVTW